MELDKLWSWQKKKLACRIRPENCNPAGDSLRETFAEMAGIDLNDLLNEMKSTKKKKEQTNKVLIDHEGDKKFKEVLTRSRVLGATRLALESMQEVDQAKANAVTNKNIRKQFALIPKSPPKRVVLEIQRERSKPLRLPDQEEQKTATADKLEKKLAKQRAARMAAIEQSAKNEEALKKTGAENKDMMLEHARMILAEYQGDLFGTGGHYLDGMMYLSRMDSSTKKLKTAAFLGGDRKDKEVTKASVEADKKATKDASENELKDQAKSNEVASNPDANAKFQCAVSLCNWSRNPANSSRLASEGAVRAIMQLSMEPIPRIVMYCTAALRFMSEHLELATSMIDEGAITTISEIVSSTSDDFVAYNLAIALVNLTRVNGKEGQVVEAAIVLALMNLIMLKPELGSTCVRGLYNLTCVDLTYTSIERVIRALVSLSLSGTNNVKHLCAAALCNLSDLKSVRARMVEEGAINVLSALSRGAETRTRRVCAVILQNLSAAKSVRVEMASRNSVAAAYGLSSDQDPIILRCIGLTLSRLAMESTNAQRIIHEGGIAGLCNIAVKYPTIPGISQPVASAFQLLSSNQAYRVTIVNEGSVTAIASLLRSSVDMFTLQHSLLALCNLLCEPDNHLPIIQQGLIMTLITMCEQDNDLIKDFCSLAFLNLSCAEDSRKHIVNAGSVSAIISIAAQDSDVTKKRCAATLCNLSSYTAGMQRMVADGIIPSIVSLVLAKDIFTVHYSCAALCRLCCTVENSRLILESGAVPNLVQGAIDGDQVTKQFCGAVLSSLSFYESCRLTLSEMGSIAALKGLAELNDDVTKQRCLVAFANLSCEVSVQNKMIKEGVVSIIAELANSYQEINYICCAKAICNLACNPGTKLAVATEGGVHALLMISMVQSVDRLTKLLCVLGLNNLLDETTIEFMLEEGLVGSIANLSRIGDSHISNLSAKIFNHLTQFPTARAKMTERGAALNALFKLCDSRTMETQVIATRTTCNLIFDSHVRGSTISAGAFTPLEKSIDMEDQDTVRQCLKTLFSVCSTTKFMESLTKTAIPHTLVHFATQKTTEEEDYLLVVKSLAMLTWDKKSRLFLQKRAFVSLMFKLVNENLMLKGVEFIAATIRFLILGYSDVAELLELGIVSTLIKLNEQVKGLEKKEGQQAVQFLIASLRTLSGSEAHLEEIATDGVIGVLHTAVKMCTSAPATMYDIAALMYLFSSHSAVSRAATAVEESLSILDCLKSEPKCTDLLAITLGLYLGDQKNRAPFLDKISGGIIVKISEQKIDEITASNLVLAIYTLTRIPSCREFLVSPEVEIEKIIGTLSTIDSPKIKANCNRASKNLSSDLNEAIEEGAVANLIAMSLEGKLKNQSSDEFVHPSLIPEVEKGLPAPSCSSEVDEISNGAEWFELVKVTKGGAAGKGPEPPEPPFTSLDGSSEYPNMAEELDSGESDGKTKMSFAKMQVPRSMKDSFMLTDADFAVKPDDASTSVGEENMESADPLDDSIGTPRREKSMRSVNSSRSLSRAPSLRNANRGAAQSGTLSANEGSLSPTGEGRNNQGGSTSVSPNTSRRFTSEDKRTRSSSNLRLKDGENTPSPSKKRKNKNAAKDGNMSEQAAKLGLYA